MPKVKSKLPLSVTAERFHVKLRAQLHVNKKRREALLICHRESSVAALLYAHERKKRGVEDIVAESQRHRACKYVRRFWRIVQTCLDGIYICKPFCAFLSEHTNRNTPLSVVQSTNKLSVGFVIPVANQCL